MHSGIIGFVAGMLVTVILFCIAGILAARREHGINTLTQLGIQVARHATADHDRTLIPGD